MKTINSISKKDILRLGRHATRQMRGSVVGLVAGLDGAVEQLAAELDQATTEVERAVRDARGVDEGLRKGARDKESACRQGYRVLARFSRHLDTHPPGTVDRKVFIPESGKLDSVGRRASRVLQALQHVAGELAREDTGVTHREEWLALVVEAATRLEPGVVTTARARAERANVTPELREARERWWQTYRGVRLAVTGILTVAGKREMLDAIFDGGAAAAAPKAPSALGQVPVVVTPVLVAPAPAAPSSTPVAFASAARATVAA